MTSPLLNHSSGLVGCFNPVPAGDSARIQATLTTALREPATLSVAGAFCAVSGGGILEQNGLLLAMAGRARYAGGAEKPAAVLRALAADYRTLGPAILRKLSGRFTLAILDPAQRTALLAIDRIGLDQLYYAPQAESLLFATMPAALIRAGGFDADIDPQAIYNYLYCHMIPSPRTIYRGLRKGSA